jgi:hypothetical protein
MPSERDVRWAVPEVCKVAVVPRSSSARLVARLPAPMHQALATVRELSAVISFRLFELLLGEPGCSLEVCSFEVRSFKMYSSEVCVPEVRLLKFCFHEICSLELCV